MGLLDKLFGRRETSYGSLRVYDICNKDIGLLEGTVVSISEMKTIARNCFGPHKLGLVPPGLSLSLGISIEDADNNWRQRVLADTTPWLLCETCYSKTRPYAR